MRFMTIPIRCSRGGGACLIRTKVTVRTSLHRSFFKHFTWPLSFCPLANALPWSVTATEWAYPALMEVTRISLRDVASRGTGWRLRVGSLPIILRCLAG